MEAVRMETVRGESGLGCKLIGEADWRREVSLDQLLAVDPPSSPHHHHPPQRQVKKKQKKNNRSTRPEKTQRLPVKTEVRWTAAFRRFQVRAAANEVLATC